MKQSVACLAAVLVAVLVAPAAAPVQALPRKDDWIELRTANFTLYTHAGEQNTRRIAADLERLRDVLAQLAPGVALNSPTPTYIYVFKNGAAFRRARVAMLGEHGPTEYRIEMDFALAGRPSFLDVWAGVKDVPYLGALRIGHFFEPFSLERYTPNRFMTFMERSLTFQSLTPFRRLGIGFYDWSEDLMTTWAASGFRSGQDQFGDTLADRGGYGAAARLTST